MSEWPSNIPPEGVSTTDGLGGHQPVRQFDGSPTRSKGRRRSIGEDVLANLQAYKKESSSGMTPAGVKSAERDIRVGAMPKTRRPRRNMATFTSVDGSSYTFRTHDTKGKELPHNRLQMLFVAMREIALGGSPLPVYKSFRVTMKDIDDRQFFPFTEETIEAIRIRNGGAEAVIDEEDEEEAGSFALGAED